MERTLDAIFALGKNDALGRSGGLPWSHPEDAAYFDAVTRGHAVIMGRRTWEERGVPLAGRFNVVVSRTAGDLPGAEVARTLQAALDLAFVHDPTPFVIGGAAILREAMPLVERVYLTRIPESPPADTFYAFDPTPFRLERSRRSKDGLEFQVWLRYRSTRPVA